MPFGGGRRVCIGAGFSIMEATLITAMCAQRFRFDLTPDAHIVPETTITLRPRHGLPMTLHHRAAEPNRSAVAPAL
jgi:cytochrome P450